jgi:hypothetical protein
LTLRVPIVTLTLFLAFALSSAVSAQCIAPPVGDAAPLIQAKLSSGQNAVLCPSSTYTIQSTIVYPNSGVTNVAVYTEGLPTDGTRALLVLVPPASNPGISTMFDATAGYWIPGANGATLKNVRIDGGSRTYGLGNYGALVAFGGTSTGQVVEYVEAKYARNWSHIQVKDVWDESRPYPDRCNHATVQNNDVGYAGTWPLASSLPNYFSDGLSIGCADSQVLNNTITDFTDVGIAIFGSPGTRFAGNNIRLLNNKCIGGISMSDLWTGFDPDNSGTVVENNHIYVGCSGYAPFGISMGVRMGGCGQTYFSHGARVINNDVTGRVGYGFAVAGVFWWEATGNTYYTGFCNWQDVGPGGHVDQACTMPGGAAGAFVYEPGYTTGRPDCDPNCFQPEFSSRPLLANSQIRY